MQSQILQMGMESKKRSALPMKVDLPCDCCYALAATEMCLVMWIDMSPVMYLMQCYWCSGVGGRWEEDKWGALANPPPATSFWIFFSQILFFTWP